MEYIIPAASAIVVAIIEALAAKDRSRAKDGELPDEDLYLCTCVPGGEEFEIYIVVLEMEQ